jgi:hypothetical protein
MHALLLAPEEMIKPNQHSTVAGRNDISYSPGVWLPTRSLQVAASVLVADWIPCLTNNNANGRSRIRQTAKCILNWIITQLCSSRLQCTRNLFSGRYVRPLETCLLKQWSEVKWGEVKWSWVKCSEVRWSVVMRWNGAGGYLNEVKPNERVVKWSGVKLGEV